MRHYRRLGHELTTISMRGLPKLMWGELRLSFFFLRWPSIRRELPSYDCVHLHGPAPTFSDLFLLLLRATVSRKSSPKVVYTHHFELDLPGLRLACRLYNRVHARIVRLADSVVVTTRAYERLLLERDHLDATVIPWGADHRACRPRRREEGRFDILAVAQLRPYKGLGVLLEAFARVPEAHLHVVGDGRRRRRLEALAARLELNRVRFHGNLSDSELCGLLATSRVIVLPSISMMEAFGLSLLEGMTMGCVPVASDLPGIAEVVGDAGRLVPPGDADALAEALRCLRQDRVLWERLSLRARLRAASFRWEGTAGEYVALFERLLKEGPGPARLPRPEPGESLKGPRFQA
jgi:glycosyltransferase involved in cell wall biosynthesis